MSTFRPKPPPEELTAAFKAQIRDVPTAVASQPTVYGSPARAGGGEAAQGPACGSV